MSGDRVTYITCFYSTASVCDVQLASIRGFGNLWGGGLRYMGPLSNSSSLLHGLSCWTHQPIINPSSSSETMADDRLRQEYMTAVLQHQQNVNQLAVLQLRAYTGEEGDGSNAFSTSSASAPGCFLLLGRHVDCLMTWREWCAWDRRGIYTFYSGIGHVFVVRRGYAEDTSNTADIRYEYVKHTLVIRSHTLWYAVITLWIRCGYAMDTSIPTPMSTFPMQYVGKLDVLGLWQFSNYFLYTSAYVQVIRHGVTGP